MFPRHSRQATLAAFMLTTLLTLVGRAAAQAPAAPTNLLATNGISKVTLSWTGSTGATAYNIYRGTSSGAESTTPLNSSTTASYTDSSGTNGITYYYTVAAVNSTGTSAISGEASATPYLQSKISSFSPTSAVAGTAFALTVNGSGFYPTTIFEFGGVKLKPTSITSSALTVNIPAADDAAPGSVTVTVYNPSIADYSKSFTVTIPPVPAAPTSLGATPGAAKMVLSWTGSTNATSYNVYRATASGGEGATPIATSVSTASYTDTGVTPGVTYYYTVAAVDGGGTSAQSGQASGTPTYPQATISSLSPSSIAAGSPSFALTLTGTHFYPATAFKFGGVAITPSSITSTTLTATIPASDVATAGSVTVLVYNPNVPDYAKTFTVKSNAPPTNVAAVAGTGRVALSWTASAGASSYNVYESTSTGAEGATPVATGISGSSTTISALTNGTMYFFTVAAVSGGSTSPQSTEVIATPLAAPTGLAATPGNAQVALTWTTAAGDVTYNVYRSTTPGNEGTTPFATVATGTSYADTSVTNGAPYYYQISGVNGSGTSTLSSEVSTTPYPQTTITSLSPSSIVAGSAAFTLTVNGTNFYPATAFTFGGVAITPSNITSTALTVTIPASSVTTAGLVTVAVFNPGMLESTKTFTVIAAPTGLTATAGLTQVTLAWNAFTGATSYNVYRGTSSGGESATPIATGITGLAYTNKSLTNGTHYYYKIAAVGADGTSAQSAEASATPAPAPAAPTNLAATTGAASVILTWTGSSDATSYNVYRGSAAGNESSTPYASGVAGTTYVDTGVAGNGSEYSYKVKAVDGAGTSGYSNETFAWPTLDAQANPNCTLIQGTDGWLYGTSVNGGINSNGTVFRFNPVSGATQLLHTFGATAGNTDGWSPYSGLMQASDGNYYGAAFGGSGTSGVIYYIDSQYNYNLLASFTGQSGNGLAPWGSLIQIPGAPGAPVELFGTTIAGGPSGYGTVFRVDSSTGITTLHTFTKTDGWQPEAALTLGANGELYGSTYQGGTGLNGTNYNGAGTVFEVDPSGSPFSVLEQCAYSGANIMGPMVLGSDGNYYGTCENDGEEGQANGDVFKMSPAGGAFTELHDFSYSTTDGQAPTAGVVILPDGSIVGTTSAGGSANLGTVWKINSLGNFSLLHSFTGSVAGNAQASDGSTPMGGLVLCSDGYLYGTTFAGGPLSSLESYPPLGGCCVDPVYGAGTLYRISPTGNYAVVLNLDVPAVAPAGFGIAVDSPTCVTLSWTASWGAESYDIKRSISPGGPFITIWNTAGTSFQDCSLTSGDTFYYEISAVVNGVDSAPTLVLSATPSSAAQGPATLTATPASGTVALNWAAVSGASSYSVQRSPVSGGPYTAIATVSAPTVSYIDSGLTDGTAYYYVVNATTAAGESLNSSQAFATPSIPGPANLVGTAGNAVVNLAWGAVTPLTHYNVSRSTTNTGPWTVIASPTSASYADSTVTNGTTYYYTVNAVNASGTTGNSNTVAATPAFPPIAPYNLMATPGNAQVDLQWQQVGSAVSFNISRSTTNGSGYTLIANIAAANPLLSNTYADNGVSNGTTYYYIVNAVNAGGVGPKLVASKRHTRGAVTVRVQNASVAVSSTLSALTSELYK